jgi:hypothetical protein
MNMFVSYTLKDGMLSPGLLRDLEERWRGLARPYIDILHNRSSRPQLFVERKLASADLVLACVTPAFFRSPWARFELLSALHMRIPIIYLDLRPYCQRERRRNSPGHAWGITS